MPSPKIRIAEALLLLALAAPLPADVSVTQLANEGVLLSDGETRVLIDAFVVESYSVYGGLPPDVLPQFEQRRGAFGDIDLALASHRHHDHNQPRFACDFLQGSTQTDFHSGSQVIGLMREKCRRFVTTSPRVNTIDPQYGNPVELTAGTARITVFPLSHGTRKYARIQNYGHLVEMGGLKVLHIGDAAMNPEDFARAGLDGVALDVALIPFWFFQPGPGADVIRDYLDARFKIAVHIPPSEMAEVKAYMQAEYPDVMILEKTLDRAVFSSAAPPPP
ncbi:MAG: hypothetical protein HKP02_00440 [Xanthomonadales bacterium]|nr:hypothetical protein [Xanthomonadales bacterium]